MRLGIKSRIHFNEDLFTKIGVFASFLMVTALSLYIWSPAKESSAFDWTTVDGNSPYVAALSGNDTINVSATPSAAQQVFSEDDVLELNTTCPYGVGVYLNMESNESNSLVRTGDDDGIKSIAATTGTSLIDNSWGFSLDDGSTYLPMPLNGANPATVYASEQIESGTEITVKYGLKINSSIPSGYYSGMVLYSIVANSSCARYTLNFDTDGGTPIDDVSLTYGQTIDLPDYTTTKDGYDFGGWELIGSVSTTFDGSETDVDVNPGNSLTVELKAIWLAKETDFFTVRSMQSMTPAFCAEATTPNANATSFDTDGSHIGDTAYVPQTTVRDTRDGKEYVIRKLADGRCWMAENLRLGGDEPITLHPSDSNVDADYELPASSTNFNVYDSPVINMDEDNGGYYNWNAATAGEGINSMTSGDTTQSICPKGWHLPTGGSNGEFQILYNYYNSTNALMGAPGLVLSGVAGGSGLGSAGLYWSATAGSGSYAYSLNFQTPNTVYPANNSVKVTGLTVRCIADLTMQSFQESMLPAGISMKLVDERDGEYYTVKKLTDGNVWMTQNLRIGGSEPMTLTSSDSDVKNDFELPAATQTLVSTDFAAYDTKNVYVDSTYGGYYNFYTATAGEGTSTMTSGDAQHSICPRGWKLPSGHATGNYSALYAKYNSSALMRGDPGIVLAGNIASGTIYSRGEYGSYWSSSAIDANYGYSLFLNGSSVLGASYTGNKLGGFSVRCIARKPTMQTYDTKQLKNVGDSIDLIDERDGNTYTVKRLADGSVWMTQNLRIINKTINAYDSNLLPGETWTVPASNTSTFTFNQNVNSAYYDATYGGYYSFYAATAGGGGTGMTSGTVSKDICPKGWRMPIGGENSEYETLYSYYNSPSAMMGEPGFVLSGDVNHNKFEASGVNGVYWTATNANANYGYRMSISSTTVGPNQEDDKFTGHAVRCIAIEEYDISFDAGEGNLSTTTLSVSRGKTVTLPTPTRSGYVFAGWFTEETGGTEITSSFTNWTSDMELHARWAEVTMQNFTCSMLPNVGDSMTIKDVRDNNTYSVKRLSDGKCWMTQNLRLINKTITSDNSDLPDGTTWTVPASSASSFDERYNTNSAYLDSTYGGYYSLYTATAGWAIKNVYSGDTEKSICPKGWRLPTGGTSSGDYKTLISKYNSATLMTNSNGPQLTYSGYVNGGVANKEVGTSSYYWSSTVADSTYGYRLYMSKSGGALELGPNNKYVGYPIRCIARN